MKVRTSSKMKKKTNTDGIQGDFQQIHSLDEACQSSNTYMGISISFLKLYGEKNGDKFLIVHMEMI